MFHHVNSSTKLYSNRAKATIRQDTLQNVDELQKSGETSVIGLRFGPTALLASYLWKLGVYLYIPKDLPNGDNIVGRGEKAAKGATDGSENFGSGLAKSLKFKYIAVCC